MKKTDKSIPNYEMPDKTYLSNRGYAVNVETSTNDMVKYLKNMCTVKPLVNPNAPGAELAKAFPLYRESSKKLYIPRALGLELMGPPTNDTLTDGLDAPGLVFTGKLRAEQEGIIDAFLRAAQDPTRQGGIISVGCGVGKCLGKDTPVLMYDGTVAMVQDIQTGDQLMGDDSTPRNVLSTCTGSDTLYKIVQSKGDSYIVNESHILSLKCSSHPTDDPVDMSVTDYLALSEQTRASLHGYRVSIEFVHQEVPVDAYLFGIWVGGGMRGGRCLPLVYKCNSRSVRMQVLAGVIDESHCNSSELGVVIPLANEVLVEDIMFVCRSLGFAAYKHESPFFCCACVVSGRGLQDVPTKIYRFQLEDSLQDDVLMTHIQVVRLDRGSYYGFEIDGNRRFLLGDFTVTHNTTMSLYIASEIKKKTLVICHKEFLINQWRERIEQFLPHAKVGLIKAKTLDVEGKDIVLASLQSIAMKDYDTGLFEQFGFVAIDEVHHTSAEVFSRALPKITARVMLGLSATLDRKDGLRKVFEWHLGHVVHDPLVRSDKEMIIEMQMFSAEELEEVHMWNGKLNVAAMINNLCACQRRNDLIIDKLEEVLRREPGRRTLILSDRRAHLQQLERMIKERDLGTTGYYVGGMKEADLDASAKCDIILGTNMMAAEGMDIPVLNTLVLASPVSSVEQQLGRVQRQKPHERRYIPYTIDVWDDLSIFKNQGVRRRSFYKRAGYEITGSGHFPKKDNNTIELPTFAFLDT